MCMYMYVYVCVRGGLCTLCSMCALDTCVHVYVCVYMYVRGGYASSSMCALGHVCACICMCLGEGGMLSTCENVCIDKFVYVYV